MDNETKLPMDWKPLREAAEGAAREAHNLFALLTRGVADGWSELYDDAQDTLVRVHALLLADLNRPASRDWAARLLAEKVGLTVGATAPAWTYTAANGRDSVAVWMLACGGRHWALCDYPPHIERVLGPPTAYGDMISVRNLPTDPAAALRAALLAVVPHV